MWLRSNEAFEAVARVADAKALEPVEYALPDGRSISVAPDVQALPSIYFECKHSQLPPSEPVAAPIWHLTLASVLATEAEWHKELVRNVILTGGASLLPGLPERLELELRQAMRNVSKVAGHEVPSISSQAHRLGLLGAPHERLPERAPLRTDGAEPHISDAATAGTQHHKKEAAQPVPASPGLPPGAHPQGRLAPRRPEAERGRAARDVFPDSAGRQRGRGDLERRDRGVYDVRGGAKSPGRLPRLWRVSTPKVSHEEAKKTLGS